LGIVTFSHDGTHAAPTDVYLVAVAQSANDGVFAIYPCHAKPATPTLLVERWQWLSNFKNEVGRTFLQIAMAVRHANDLLLHRTSPCFTLSI
jgi:hypothetical protein